MTEIYPDFELTDPELVAAPIIFGSGRYDARDIREPVIVRRVGNAWKFVELSQLNHTAWVYAGSSFERGELWAILDSTPESSGAGLYLFKSTDHGETWKAFSVVKPPTLMAEFIGFTMTSKGVGRITVHEDDDTEATPRGTYTYTSMDDGLTWTGPKFTADDLVSAETPLNPSLQETIADLDGDTTAPGRAGTRGRSGNQPAQRGRGRGG